MARFLLWVALTVFNISAQTLARFLLCVCAREIVSRGTLTPTHEIKCFTWNTTSIVNKS